MKSSTLLSFLMFFNGVAHAALLKQTVINKKAQQIKTRMTCDRYSVYGLTALSIGFQLRQTIFEMYKNFKSDSVATKTPEEKKTMLEGIKAGLRYMFYTTEGWSSTIQCAVGIGSSMFISHLCEKLTHPDTLRWYINSYAPYHITIKMMKKQVLQLQQQAEEVERAKANKESLLLLYDRLVRQAESICAYMTYKTSWLDDEEKVIGKRAQEAMLMSQNRWLDRIGLEVSSDQCDYQKLYDMVIAYENDSIAHIKHFYMVEGETLYDRSVVRNQMQEKIE